MDVPIFGSILVPSYARSVDCLTLKVTARFSETSGSIRPLTQRYLPRELDSSTTTSVIILTPILCHLLSIYNVLDIYDVSGSSSAPVSR
jgi:hypothetical protein